MRITVWNENIHETRGDEIVRANYPDGIHGAIAAGLRQHFGAESDVIRTATLRDPEHGLTQEVLDATDVLLWWGHVGHAEVSDEVVDRVHRKVIAGMGLLVLHSGHYSKIFKRLLGTSCSLTWREAGERERLWVCNPGHPIAAGVGDYFELPHEEMYGEPFGVPPPDEQVFISWFEGGEVFRSGCCWIRGNGRIFYFRPGHETYPTYFDTNVRRVLANAVQWARPQGKWLDACPNKKIPLEHLSSSRDREKK
jgi:trehalose utilization protein